MVESSAAAHPTDETLRQFLRDGGSHAATQLVRHLLAGCRFCLERVRAALTSLEYNYDKAFVGAYRALSDFFAKEKLLEYPVEALLQELAQMPEAEQLQRVGLESRFASPALVRRLVEDSHASRYGDPSRVLHLATLARLAAEACSVESAGSKPKLADVRGQGWRQYGNALRVLGRLREAEEALATARSCLEEGTRDPLLRAQLCVQQASLRRRQARFAEAIELSEEAEHIYTELEDDHALASTLVQKALANSEVGEPEEAVDILNRAIPLIDSEGDPRLLLAACHNLARCYVDLDRPEQALSIYIEAQSLYKEFDGPFAWQEGLLLRDLGHLRAAEGKLLRARQDFLERGLQYEAALVSPDLAPVYVKLGDKEKLSQLVTETEAIFSRVLGREALAAFRQLKQLAEKMTPKQMIPEQTQASEYLRRAGSQAPVADIRRKVAETLRELDELVTGIPEEVVRVRPRPGRWCVQEVVDHLIVSHRPAGEELAGLLQGQVPEGEPIPPSLQSPDVMEKEWSGLVRELSAVHGRMASLVADAPEDTPLQARAPVWMVIMGLEWIEVLDWKAYAMALRAHALGHAGQIRAVLAELEEGRKKKRSGRRKIAAPEFGLKEVW